MEVSHGYLWSTNYHCKISLAQKLKCRSRMVKHEDSLCICFHSDVSSEWSIRNHPALILPAFSIFFKNDFYWFFMDSTSCILILLLFLSPSIYTLSPQPPPLENNILKHGFYDPCASWATDITTYPSCSRAINRNMAFGSSLGSNRHQQCPCITIGHPDKHSLGKSMALRQHHSLRWLTRPWTFAEPWVVTGVTVTLRVWPLQGHRTKHDLRQKSGLGHLQVPRWQLQPPPDQYVPSTSMVLGQQRSLRRPNECHASTDASVLMGAMDINSDPGLCRAMNPNLVLSSSSVLENTIASDSSRCHSA